MSEPEIERDRWGRPLPKRWKPREATPEFKARIARLRAGLLTCDGRDDGLDPCPDCGGTTGVHMIRRAGGPYASSRLHRVLCPCGAKGPIVYGSEDAKRAWNDPEWRAGRAASPSNG